MASERFEVRQRPGEQLWDVFDLERDGRVIGRGRPKAAAVEFAIELDTESQGVIVRPWRDLPELVSVREGSISRVPR